MLKRFFDMPFLLVTGLAFGFAGASIIVVLLRGRVSNQDIRYTFLVCSFIPVIIGGVWDARNQFNQEEEG